MLSQRVKDPSFLQLHSISWCNVTAFLPIHLQEGCFQFLVTVNCMALNIGVHIFFPIGVLSFLGYIPRGELQSQMAVTYLIF